MRLNPQDSLHGVPILKVRDALRKVAPQDVGGAQTWEYAAEGLSAAASRRLMEGLLADGYIVAWAGGLRTKFSKSHFVNRTEKGNRLASATARSLKRATADRYIQTILERAASVNADDRFCYRATTLVVFGSYMDESKQSLGDVDVAMLAEDRYPDRALMANGQGAFHAAREASIRRAIKAGRHLSSIIDRLLWPDHEFRLALKGHLPGLSLHDLRADILAVMTGPHRVLLGAIPADLLAEYERQRQERAATSEESHA